MTNRRLAIVYFWLFRNQHAVSVGDMLRFLGKPQVKKVGERFIRSITDEGEYRKVIFYGLNDPLYWPTCFPIAQLWQVAAEGFDLHDWHRYERDGTLVEPLDVVADIGAAEGLFSLVAIHRCSRAHLVEPSARFCAALARTFKPYMEANKAVLHRVAVGTVPGFVSTDENGLSGKVKVADTGIPLTTIDALFSGERITYLKADIEGYEMDMLRGAAETIRRDTPKLAIACYHKDDWQDLAAFIKHIEPRYTITFKGVFQFSGRPVMIHGRL